MTQRQREILEYITQRIRAGLPPTVREIATHFEMKSPNAVRGHLQALVRRGHIELLHTSRGIRLTEDHRGELKKFIGTLPKRHRTRGQHLIEKL